MVVGLVVVMAIVQLSQMPHSVQPTADQRFAKSEASDPDNSPDDSRPSDWFFKQRAFPFDAIPRKSYYQAVETVREMKAMMRRSPSTPVWQPTGPTNVPGRVTDLAANPTDRNTVYAATASGGVFKSTDQGQSWHCVTDALGLSSVGAVAVDPTNPEVVYVGTGEANVRNYSYEGNGVYRSTDAGQTWTSVGLVSSGRIARIVIDPDHPDTIFVAALGPYYSDSRSEYGVYRSTDGGASWERVLDPHGCIDLVFRPGGTLLAALWQVPYGSGSGVYRSTDYGDNWVRLGQAEGLPLVQLGANRIGLALEPVTGIAYAQYAANDGSFWELFRSIDVGASWMDLNASELATLNAGHRYGWYFGQVRVAPGSPQVVFATGFNVWRSVNSGGAWIELIDEYLPVGEENMHVDQHAMWIDPNDPYFIYAGNDGGVYTTTDMGDTWTRVSGFPCTQFYAVTMDYQYPERKFGGTQDNGTLATFDGTPDNWEHVGCCDGFFVVVDYSDSSIVYSESQYGRIRKSTDGGHSFSLAVDGIGATERGNWRTPIVMHPTNPEILYTGTRRVYRTINRAEYWTRISPYLTDHTITAIAVARSDPDVIYVGTEDAAVWVTIDGGAEWTFIADSLPERWVTSIAVDPLEAAIAYVTHSGYRDSGIDLYPDPPPSGGEMQPYVSRTTDFGQTWTDITGNLPQAPVNDIVIDDHFRDHLMVGSDVGVFESFDLGLTWSPLGEGLPTTIVMDLEFHKPTRALLVGTHGRSMYQTVLPCGEAIDTDGDGVPDDCDACPDADDAQDADNDRVPDDCDLCPGFSDNADADADGVPNDCDNCPGGDDFIDPDSDGVPSDCDNCPEAPNPDQLDVNENGTGDACETCCGFWTSGFRGNTNCSEDGKRTLSDITTLIDRVYISKLDLCCEANGNVNGGIDAKITLADITRLIDHVYISKEETAACE
jgi:photosystem II stability/assembly factor-like uncharacterized protein